MAQTHEKVHVRVDMNITGDWSAHPLIVIEGITAGVKGWSPRSSEP